MVMLGLGGSSEEADDDGEADTEFRDDDRLFLFGISGIPSVVPVVPPPSPGGGNFDDERRVDPARQKL